MVSLKACVDEVKGQSSNLAVEMAFRGVTG